MSNAGIYGQRKWAKIMGDTAGTDTLAAIGSSGDSDTQTVYANMTFAGTMTITGAMTISGAIGLSAALTMGTTTKIQFRDTGIYINSGADGKLTISADGTGADDVTIGCTLTVSDSVVIADAKNITIGTTGKLQLRDTGIYINSGADGKLTIAADGTGADDITLSGSVTITEGITMSGTPASAIDLTGVPTGVVFKSTDDGTVCADTGDMTGTAAGFLKCTIGAATRYVQLYQV